MRRNSFLHNVAALLVGGYFIVSGIGKTLDVQQLLQTIQIYGVPSMFAPVGLLIPPLEIVLGLLIIIPGSRKIGSIAILALLVVFTGAYANAHFYRGIENCGCGGRFAFLEKDFSELLTINGGLAILSAILFALSGEYARALFRQEKMLIYVAAIASCTAVAVPSIELLGQNKIIEAGSDSVLQIVPTSKDSTYAIFFYELDCAHCWDAIVEVDSLQIEKVVDKVIAYSFGTDSDLVLFENRFHPNFETHLIPVDQFFRLTSSVPTLSFVRNKIVIYTDEGQVKPPSWYEENVFKGNPNAY